MFHCFEHFFVIQVEGLESYGLQVVHGHMFLLFRLVGQLFRGLCIKSTNENLGINSNKLNEKYNEIFQNKFQNLPFLSIYHVLTMFPKHKRTRFCHSHLNVFYLQQANLTETVHFDMASKQKKSEKSKINTFKDFGSSKGSESLSSMDSMESTSVVANIFTENSAESSSSSASQVSEQKVGQSSSQLCQPDNVQRHRRRECPHCSRRFTSFHAVAMHLTVRRSLS